jgi:hypothetical protein
VHSGCVWVFFCLVFKVQVQILDLQSEEDSFRNTSILERKP